MNGTCQFPQLTYGGLEDAFQHGQDLWKLYGEELKLLPNYPDPSRVFHRASSSTLTENTAGGVIRGMWPLYILPVPLYQQGTGVDTISEGYSCPIIGTLQSQYESASVWQQHFQVMAPVVDSLDSITVGDASAWHASFDHYNDNFQSHTCNGYSLPFSVSNSDTCVSQQQADQVFNAGDFEWNYYWVAQENTTDYITGTEGLFIGEISQHLTQVSLGKSSLKFSHIFAHDGDVGSVAGALGIELLRWPGMDSNIAFELWEETTGKTKEYFVRVLYCGAPIRSTKGDLNWMALDNFQNILGEYINPNMVEFCNLS